MGALDGPMAAARRTLSAGAQLRNVLVAAHWRRDRDVFWYRRETRGGIEYRIVDAAKLENQCAFDHEWLAHALSREVNAWIDPAMLPIEGLQPGGPGEDLHIDALGATWQVAPGLSVRKLREFHSLLESVAPNGRLTCFRKDDNLWLRDLRDASEWPITADGEPDLAYGASAQCTQLDIRKDASASVPFVLWSPDSSKLLTFRTDERCVRTLPVTDYAFGAENARPRVTATRVALPGDVTITTFVMCVIDVATGAVHVANHAPLAAVRNCESPLAGGRAWWSADATAAYFIDIDRGEASARVVRLDGGSTECSIVFEESAATYLDLGGNLYGPCCIEPIAHDELLWYSERSGWAHLYRYDLLSGRLIRQLTEGDWVVRDLLHVDATRREILIAASGRRAGEDPYVRSLFTVSLDDARMRPILEDGWDHLVLTSRSVVIEGVPDSSARGVAPSGDYLVETHARPDSPPVSVLRDRTGKVLLELERCDVSGLGASWVWPERAHGVAADGTTDIWCTVFTPPQSGAAREFPIVDYIYAGPQVSTAPVRAFQTFPGWSVYMEMAALCALGLIVVAIDGRGTGNRSRAFRDTCYGNLPAANSLDDHVCLIRQLARHRSCWNPDRLGIVGFSAGGYAASRAVLEHAHAFKAAVAISANHEPQLFWASWSERYLGRWCREYASHGNAARAAELGGRLLLIHGLLDTGCNPAGLFHFIGALNAAGKEFDLLLLPEAGHVITESARERSWSHLLRHLDAGCDEHRAGTH